MKTALLLLSTLLPASIAAAGVTPLNRIVKANQSWTVPPGKTAIVTHIMNAGGLAGTLNATRIFVDGASASEYVSLASFGISSSTVGAEPVHFGEGTRFDNENTERAIIIFGKLADSADLFAAVPSVPGEVRLSGAQFTAEIKAQSGRPARVVAEQSGDLETWTAAPASAVVRTGPGTHIVTLDREPGEKSLFLRTKIISRSSH